MTEHDGASTAWRYVWLLRHAKTNQAPPPDGGGDHARVLTPRGRRDADALGRRLRRDRAGLSGVPLPSVVLCSNAARTIETADRALGGLDPRPTVLFDRSIYGASSDELMEELRVVDAAADAVMVVGHNPGIHELAAELLSPGRDADRVAHTPMRTCGLTVIGWSSGRWLDIAPGNGTLVARAGPPYEPDD